MVHLSHPGYTMGKEHSAQSGARSPWEEERERGAFYPRSLGDLEDNEARSIPHLWEKRGNNEARSIPHLGRNRGREAQRGAAYPSLPVRIKLIMRRVLSSIFGRMGREENPAVAPLSVIKLTNMSHFCSFLTVMPCSSWVGFPLILPKIGDQEVRTEQFCYKVDKCAKSRGKVRFRPVLP